MKRRFLKIGAGLTVVALLAAACGDDDDAASSPDPTEQPADSGETTTSQPGDDGETTTSEHGDSGDAASPVSTGAAELRAGLTSLLQEHVYLAGAAIATAVQAGGDLENPAVESAVDTLDANSVAISDAIASVYGADAAEQFLELWRNHIGFFVEYTLGGATGDQDMQDAARQKLDDYRADFGAFIDSATDGNLDAATVADNLQVHVDTLIEAVDAVLAASPDVFPELREAAQHMPGTALALAGAIAAQNPDQFPA